VTGAEALRVGDAERTKVTEALHDHFAQGRLTRDELDERLDATLSAKTFGELRKITRDLPGTAPVAEPAISPRAVPPHWHGPRLAFLPLLVGAFLVIAALSWGVMGAMFGIIKVIFLIWLVMGLLGFMHARRRHRRGRRSGPADSWPADSWPRDSWQGPYGRRSRGGPWQRRGPRRGW
jgi:Flp pilus assembly protein TadB